MNSLRLVLLTQCLFFVYAPTASATSEIVIDYSEPLQQLIYRSTSRSTGSQKPDDTRIVSMQFDAFGRRFDLALEENRSLMSAAQSQRQSDEIGIYRGRIADGAASWIRLTIANGVPRGMLWDGQEMYAIDMVSGRTAIYRLADLRISGDALTCSLVDSTGNASEFLKTVVAEAYANANLKNGPGAISELDLAVIGDFEFSTDMGASAEAEILTRMNNVDGIFSAQVGVQLNVNQIDVYSSSNDPFTNESVPIDLLNELSAFRQATSSQRTNGLSHLFTGRELDGSTVGIAFGGGYGGGLCSRRFGAGLTQATHGPIFDSLIVAHELGHNFGSPHDGTSGSNCEAEAQDYLMAPSLNGSDTFSACSIVQIQDDVDNAACIIALPTADVAIVAEAPLSTAFLGNPGTIVFDVNSTGTDAISNVEAVVSIPANVTLSSAASSGGNCTSGAGDATCSLGTIAAGSGVTITIAVSTPSTGSADFVATVTADGDTNANNNQASTLLTIEPAVELVLNTGATVQVMPNQTAMIRPRVENRATLPATNVMLTVTPNAGITFESATWGPGSCVIADSVVTCQAATLAPLSNDELLMQVTGIVEGAQSYAVTITSSETDRNEANNSVTGQINVGLVATTTAAASSDESGGGALSLVFLLLLAAGQLLSMRRSLAQVPRAN